MRKNKLQKSIENLIWFWIAQKWKMPSQARLQVNELGCRGGVGEGSVNYIYRIIVNVFTGSYFQRPKAQDLHATRHKASADYSFCINFYRKIEFWFDSLF